MSNIDRHRSAFIAAALGALVGVVLLAASAGKAWHAREFLHVVAYLLPPSIRTAELARLLVIAVLFFECFAGVCLLFGTFKHLISGAVFIALCVFSLALLALLDPQAPSCGCLGIFQSIQKSADEASVGLVRNIALLWITGWLWTQSRPARVSTEGAAALHS